MPNGSIVMIGWPNSGKTNYLAALWDALRTGQGKILAPVPPDDLRYVEEALAFQSKGEFAPRSDKNIEESRRDFSVAVKLKNQPNAALSDIVVPDITGELWKHAVETTEIATDWLEELQRASGAILFVRVLSEDNCVPLDWVTSEKFLATRTLSEAQQKKAKGIPTQIALCEMLRFLEHALPTRSNGKNPKVAIVVTAWDLIDTQTAGKGPEAYLRKEYPLFSGRLIDTSVLDVSVFGMSALGGDFADPEFKEKYFKGQVTGYVTTGGGKTQVVEPDITAPIAWIIAGNEDQ